MKKVMKRVSLIGVTLLFAGILKAQAPQGINYQGVLRDASGNLMVSQSVNLDIWVDDNNCNCTVYEETQTTTTDAYGLFAVVIGSGTPITGNFAAIDWSNGVFSFGVKVNGSSLGTTEIKSVPYALFADSANGVKNSLWKDNAGLAYRTGKVAIGSSNSTATFGSYTSTLNGGTFGPSIANYMGVTNLNGWADALQIRVKNGTTGLLGGKYLECGRENISGFFDSKFSLDLTGSIITKGNIRVDSIANPSSIANSSTPVKNTVYGNSLPLAYGNVSSAGSLFENYGIATITHTGTGLYELTLTNPAKNSYFPIITVTPFSLPSSIFLIANQSYNSTTKKITVKIISSTGTAIDADFSIVAFGIAQ